MPVHVGVLWEGGEAKPYVRGICLSVLKCTYVQCSVTYCSSGRSIGTIKCCAIPLQVVNTIGRKERIKGLRISQTRLPTKLNTES